MHRLVHRVVDAAKVGIARLRGAPASSQYVTASPSAQHALDMFEGEWSSYLPGDLGSLKAGPLPLFHDPRLDWALERLGGATGASVLELGPLEGAHTWMLERAGAASILAIEANRRAFLRCLVLKEILGTTRSRFLLGDFMAYLRDQPEARFDLGLASGVLYHMEDPVSLLSRLARACSRLYLWTHYYDLEYVRRRPRVHARFGAPVTRAIDGFVHTLYPHRYEQSRFAATFCGSGETAPNWLDREGLMGALEAFGFDLIEVSFEEPSHIHGPALALVASRPAGAARARGTE